MPASWRGGMAAERGTWAKLPPRETLSGSQTGAARADFPMGDGTGITLATMRHSRGASGLALGERRTSMPMGTRYTRGVWEICVPSEPLSQMPALAILVENWEGS